MFNNFLLGNVLANYSPKKKKKKKFWKLEKKTICKFR